MATSIHFGYDLEIEPRLFDDVCRASGCGPQTNKVAVLRRFALDQRPSARAAALQAIEYSIAAYPLSADRFAGMLVEMRRREDVRALRESLDLLIEELSERQARLRAARVLW